MRCRHAKKLLFDYIDGVVSESDRVGLEHHLSGCGACEALASSLSRSLDLLHKLPSASPSENFNWKLRLRLAKAKNAWRDAVASERARQRVWNTRFAVGAVSAFLVVLVGGVALLKSDWGQTGGGARFARLPDTSLQERPAARDTRGQERSSAYVPFSWPPSNGIVSQPVATGAPRGWETGVGERTLGPIIDVDSLRVRYIESRLEAQRIRRLEQQIELLHNELEECNRDRDK